MNRADELEPGQLCDCSARGVGAEPVRILASSPRYAFVKQVNTGEEFAVGRDDLTPWSAEREAAWNEGQP